MSEPRPIWDPRTPFPAVDAMFDIEVVTHVIVERAQRGHFHYLHETTMAFHQGLLYLGWASHPEEEKNELEESIRGCTSADGGLTWSPREVWAAPPLGGAECWNQPIIFTHGGTLYGAFTRWDHHQPRTQLFTRQASSWQASDCFIDGFLPFQPPRQLADGRWIIGGERGWEQPAVAICHDDRFAEWQVVDLPQPAGKTMLFPETALVEQGDRLTAIMRSSSGYAWTSTSDDLGTSWGPSQRSNLPMGSAKPATLLLSSGQQVLAWNNHEHGRALLQLAWTDPGGSLFRYVRKLRHQPFPRRRLYGGHGRGSRVGETTEWSYPNLLEHDGRLYISYTIGKEDGGLSIVPMSILQPS